MEQKDEWKTLECLFRPLHEGGARPVAHDRGQKSALRHSSATSLQEKQNGAQYSHSVTSLCLGQLDTHTIRDSRQRQTQQFRAASFPYIR